MKYLLLLFVAVAVSCQKSPTTEIPDMEGTMQIVRDCSGTYLRFNNLDYQVCNEERLGDDSYGMVSVKRLDRCDARPGYICQLYHPNEGWVKVLDFDPIVNTGQ